MDSTDHKRDVHVSEHTREYLGKQSIHELLDFLESAQTEIEELRVFCDQIHEELASRIDGKSKVFDGMILTKRYTPRRRWDHDSLFSAAKKYADNNRIVIDREAGEIEDAVAAFERVLRDWAGNPSYWRIGALVKAGLQLDEYATTTWGPVRVEVTLDAHAKPSPEAVPVGDEPDGSQRVRSRDS